jgi:hypothetical protein
MNSRKKNGKLELIIVRERRSYLFAATCSAVAALFMFYKLFLNDLYLKFLDFKWFGLVVGLLILGNIIHGFFAFKSFNDISSESTLLEIKKVKKTYYISLIVNFFSPYLSLIILFIFINEFSAACVAMALLILMILGCYFLDLKPIMSLKD